MPRGAARRCLTLVQSERAAGMLDAGPSVRRVATQLNAVYSVIVRLWRRFRDTGEGADWPKSRRWRSTTSSEDHTIVVATRRTPYSSAKSHKREMLNASGLRIFYRKSEICSTMLTSMPENLLFPLI